jgi:hypothetical protein
VEPCGIESVDGESSMTTLRAARTTREPIAGPMRRFGQRSVHNLYELCVACRPSHRASIAEADFAQARMDLVISTILIGNLS